MFGQSSFQLVSLVRSKNWKEYGNEAVNKRLISDIKDLEDFGITIESPLRKNVKAGLAYLVSTKFISQ